MLIVPPHECITDYILRSYVSVRGRRVEAFRGKGGREVEVLPAALRASVSLHMS